MDKEIVKEIYKWCKNIKQKMNIPDKIIRDDVFELLQKSNCTVLYYPLPDEVGAGDDGCAGCHVEKVIGDRVEQFVFINTSNTRERQAFSAAHELGHIWQIDEKVYEALPECRSVVSNEEIINRFAAELLMPEKEFCDILNEQLTEINYNGHSLSVAQLLEISAYLMYYFFVPFKSVIRRYHELHRLTDGDRDILFQYNNSERLREIIKAKQYTRLLIVNSEKSMDNLQEILIKADEAGILDGNLVRKMREEFDLKNIEEGVNVTVKF